MTEGKSGKRLYRSTTNKQVSGVCGGIAEYMGWDPTVVRVGWVLLTLFTGMFPGVIGYLVLAVVVPAAPSGD
ncbi:MAG: PspC domain-containing protein [Actinobacteria bacterium]|nr:PspC domain-containing protein [Actinomycetota bacterium]MCI0679513.1 PspC domain-containing protein [Actinomycetota bacterium]